MSYNPTNQYFEEEEINQLFTTPEIQVSSHQMPPPRVPVEEGASGSASRPKSKVWNHFEKIPCPTTEEPNRIFLNCKICYEQSKKITGYKWRSDDETGTATRHLKNAHEIVYTKGADVQTESVGQSSIGDYTQLGGGASFIYNQERMIEGFSYYCLAEEHPFTFGETDTFEIFEKLYVQPQFKKVSRNTLKRRMIKQGLILLLIPYVYTVSQISP